MPTRKVNAYKANAFPINKYATGEDKCPASTGSRRLFFNHVKVDYMHTRKVNAFPKNKYAAGEDKCPEVF